MKMFTSVILGGILLAGAGTSAAPSEEVIREVDGIILDAMSNPEIGSDSWAVFETGNRAKQRMGGLGAEGDLAIAAIILRILQEIKTYPITEGWNQNTSHVDYLIRNVRNDPALVPLLLGPLAEWGEFVLSAAEPPPASGICGEAAKYIGKWGSAGQRQRLIEEVRQMHESTNPNVNQMGKAVQRVIDGGWKDRERFSPREKPFHEWCELYLESYPKVLRKYAEDPDVAKRLGITASMLLSSASPEPSHLPPPTSSHQPLRAPSSLAHSSPAPIPDGGGTPHKPPTKSGHATLILAVGAVVIVVSLVAWNRRRRGHS